MSEQHRGIVAWLTHALHRDPPANVPLVDAEDDADDEPVDPNLPHEFQVPDGLPGVGGYLAGRIRSGPGPLSRGGMDCALCNRPFDDPIHTQLD